jgi:hypothetical protein
VEQSVKARLLELKFRETMFGGLEGGVEDIKVLITEHPLLNKTVLVCSHIGRRTISYFGVELPPNPTIQQIGDALMDVHDHLHEGKPLRTPMCPDIYL